MPDTCILKEALKMRNLAFVLIFTCRCHVITSCPYFDAIRIRNQGRPWLWLLMPYNVGVTGCIMLKWSTYVTNTVSNPALNGVLGIFSYLKKKSTWSEGNTSLNITELSPKSPWIVLGKKWSHWLSMNHVDRSTCKLNVLGLMASFVLLVLLRPSKTVNWMNHVLVHMEALWIQILH